MSMVQYCFTSTETMRLVRTDSPGRPHRLTQLLKPYGLLGTGRRVGKGVWKWGKRKIIYLSLHCHHQNYFCIKVGSDESHFNVSVGSYGQSHKTVSTNHNLFSRKRRAEAVLNRGPSAYQPNALPLGQTGSQVQKPDHFALRPQKRGGLLGTGTGGGGGGRGRKSGGSTANTARKGPWTAARTMEVLKEKYKVFKYAE